jgi:hypothetical protein
MLYYANDAGRGWRTYDTIYPVTGKQKAIGACIFTAIIVPIVENSSQLSEVNHSRTI